MVRTCPVLQTQQGVEVLGSKHGDVKQGSDSRGCAPNISAPGGFA